MQLARAIGELDRCVKDMVSVPKLASLFTEQRDAVGRCESMEQLWPILAHLAKTAPPLVSASAGGRQRLQMDIVRIGVAALGVADHRPLRQSDAQQLKSLCNGATQAYVTPLLEALLLGDASFPVAQAERLDVETLSGRAAVAANALEAQTDSATAAKSLPLQPFTLAALPLGVLLFSIPPRLQETSLDMLLDGYQESARFDVAKTTRGGPAPANTLWRASSTELTAAVCAALTRLETNNTHGNGEHLHELVKQEILRAHDMPWTTEQASFYEAVMAPLCRQGHDHVEHLLVGNVGSGSVLVAAAALKASRITAFCNDTRWRPGHERLLADLGTNACNFRVSYSRLSAHVPRLDEHVDVALLNVPEAAPGGRSSWSNADESSFWLVHLFVTEILHAWKMVVDGGHLVLEWDERAEIGAPDTLLLAGMAGLPGSCLVRIVTGCTKNGRPRTSAIWRKQDGGAATVGTTRLRAIEALDTHAAAFVRQVAEYYDMRTCTMVVEQASFTAAQTSRKRRLSDTDDVVASKRQRHHDADDVETGKRQTELGHKSKPQRETLQNSGKTWTGHVGLPKTPGELNPELRVEEHRVGDVPFLLVQDGVLPGGTKQRALSAMNLGSVRELIYAGPAHGFAQVALAVAGGVYGFRATVFVEKHSPLHRLTQLSVDAGGYVHSVSDARGRSGTLKRVQATSELYAHRHDCVGALLPFGLDAEVFVAALATAISAALPERLRSQPPARVWVTAGSGALSRALGRVFPNAQFVLVQVGRTIREENLTELRGRYRLLVAPERFTDDARAQPAYATVRSYDAKLWQFFCRQARAGDLVWNVGQDPQ